MRLWRQKHTAYQPLPHFAPPDWDWDLWLIKGGRGSGKTRAGVEYVMAHLRSLGAKARVGVGAPTFPDARDVCAEGESGLITLHRDEFSLYNRSMGEARHRDGGYVKFLGSEEPDRWNGPQWTLLWADELALWNVESWDQAQFGVRVGERPVAIATTTPKARKFLRELEKLPSTAVSYGTMYQNPYLSPRVAARLVRRYAGTRLERQELLGQDIEELEGALWNRAMIDEHRVPAVPAQITLVRVVAAVDPATTHGPESDETGIAVAALGSNGDYYALHIEGYRRSPLGWARLAVDLYDQYQADRMVGEINNGGEMVESNIRTVRQDIALKTIHASRGKKVRAEPIAALYEQGRVHHVGTAMERAEEQMCTFGALDLSKTNDDHDDMVDALVYALTELSEGAGSLDAEMYEPEPFEYSRSAY